MTKVNYSGTSPYALTPQSSWYLGNYVHRKIAPASDDTPLVLSADFTHRPDTLSNKLYGTPAYYWVFMARNLNVIRDPIWDFVPGIEIYVPSRDRLRGLTGGAS